MKDKLLSLSAHLDNAHFYDSHISFHFTFASCLSFASQFSVARACQASFCRFSLHRFDKTYCGAGEESAEGVNSNSRIAKNECFAFGVCINFYREFLNGMHSKREMRVNHLNLLQHLLFSLLVRARTE